MVKSIKVYNDFNLENRHKNSILLIGNFDGLIGHQKLFNLAKKYKKNFLKLVFLHLNQCQKCILTKI